MIQNSVEASRKASLRRPCWSSSVKTGTNAAERAALANRLLTRFGIWKAIVKAEAGPPVPKKLAATISRTSPAIREMPVAIEKIAVLRATPPPPGGGGGRRLLGEGFCGGGQGRYSTALRGALGPTRGRARDLRWPTFIPRRSGSCAPSASAWRTAATPPRSRLTSGVCSRSSTAVTGRPWPRPTASSTSTIDKAVKRGAMHRNTGARKKSRAARLAGRSAAGQPSSE